MNKFIITTDTTADLPADYVAEHNLPACCHSLIL